ncbi:MAG: helix-turn-helix transcriptional regulator [Ignavibacteriaceae bacterium]
MTTQTQFRSAETNLGDFINHLSHRFLSAKEAAVYTGLSLPYFRKLAKAGLLRRYTLNFLRYFYLKHDLDIYLENKIRVKREKYFSRYNKTRELISLKGERGRGK